jgi:hypothetical protein
LIRSPRYRICIFDPETFCSVQGYNLSLTIWRETARYKFTDRVTPCSACSAEVGKTCRLARAKPIRNSSAFLSYPNHGGFVSQRCITSGISDKTFVSLSILPCLMDGKSTTRRKGRLVVSLLRPPGSASLRVLAFVPLLFNHRSLSRSQVWCNPFGV